MKNDGTLHNLSNFDNKSLLIVDDDNPFRERLARAMEKKGFSVFQAEGVEKGIESVKVHKQGFGFAVVDLRLADGNGLEVVKEIQSTNSSSRIIMLTGYGNIPTAVAAIKEGAIDYLAKPADADDVEVCDHVDDGLMMMVTGAMPMTMVMLVPMARMLLM